MLDEGEDVTRQKTSWKCKFAHTKILVVYVRHNVQQP